MSVVSHTNHGYSHAVMYDCVHVSKFACVVYFTFGRDLIIWLEVKAALLSWLQGVGA